MASFKILIVDDFEDFRRAVLSVLQQKAEFQVAEASDGLQAVQRAEELQPDVILLDIGLPSLNGLEVAKRVRQVAPGARILFLSVESDPDIVKEALSLGEGYIHKPRSQSDLLPAIEAVLRGERFVSRDLGLNGKTETAHRHEILFCPDDEAVLEELTNFIATALNAGNPVLVFATELHRANLLERLRTHGADIDTAIQRGTYIASDVAEVADATQMLATLRGLCEAASKAGKKSPRVAACGERAGRLWAEGQTDAAMIVEQICDELAKYHDIDILCVYPLPKDQNNTLAFRNLCDMHTGAYSHCGQGSAKLKLSSLADRGSCKKSLISPD